MALESLLTGLAREAEVEAAALVRGARERRERLLADAAARADAVRATGLAVLERELSAAAAVAVENARRAALGRELEARASLLARVVACASERLPRRLDEPRVQALLARIVSEACDGHGAERALVRASPALVPALTERLRAHDGLTVAADPTVGTGARIVLEEGSLEVDATLESQLARLRPRLTAAVVRAVAGDAS